MGRRRNERDRSQRSFWLSQGLGHQSHEFQAAEKGTRETCFRARKHQQAANLCRLLTGPPGLPEKSREPRTRWRAGASEGGSHSRYPATLRLALSFPAHVESLPLPPWLLEGGMPTQTARSSSCKALSPVWIEQLGTSRVRRAPRPGAKLARESRPEKAPQKRVSAHLPPSRAARPGLRARFCAFLAPRPLLPTVPVPATHCLPTNLLLVIRSRLGGRMKHGPSVVLQVTKRPAPALAAGLTAVPGKTCQPQRSGVTRPLNPPSPRGYNGDETRDYLAGLSD